MNARTERIFSVLVGLDPLTSTTEMDRVEATEGPSESNEADRIAHIIALPRQGPTVAPSGAPTPSPGARNGPHLRVGAVGFLASAAIAALAMLVWASPSAGEPPGRSIDVPAQLSQVHGPLPIPAETVARA